MEMCQRRNRERKVIRCRIHPCSGGCLLTQELPIHSWNLMGPLVVSAWKSGAVSPKRSPIAAK